MNTPSPERRSTAVTRASAGLPPPAAARAATAATTGTRSPTSSCSREGGRMGQCSDDCIARFFGRHMEALNTVEQAAAKGLPTQCTWTQMQPGSAANLRRQHIGPCSRTGQGGKRCLCLLCLPAKHVVPRGGCKQQGSREQVCVTAQQPQACSAAQSERQQRNQLKLARTRSARLWKCACYPAATA
jgi:hypothetical protein